ncbi:hypothetical protein HS961_12670 [Comamonas piscis]|uniref:Uncharacterized protein n=1 Tax=Comamonas piscis TaxID=1562974 RepID=A0A7G5EHY7_9BURK|nr:hypothetical protein [Comamonas piscis]QMV73612.1 hypothetical protein HS961_12670 [Comamonas piscis]WSO32034.1 hypothetical protein VUJ63_12705 [Comamonas piscis]
MTTAINQRERLTQLAHARKPAALVAKAEQPHKKMASMRLFDGEMQEAATLASTKCWRRGFFMRKVFLMGWEELQAQEDPLQYFLASGVDAKPTDEEAKHPNVLAGLRLYPLELDAALRQANALGVEAAAPFLRFVYLLGLQLFKQQRGY